MYLFPQQEALAEKLAHIFNVFVRSEARIRPHFHMTGPSGSGKTYLIKQLAERAGIPVLEINAAGLTAEGLSGNSLSKALRNLRLHWNTPNIIFVDEFDKLFLRNGETTEGFRNSVQDEFLTALESDTVQIFTDYGKYEPVRVNNSLFIFAGAYSNQKIESLEELKDAGLRTEFVGRVPLVLSTEKIPLNELVKMIHRSTLFQEYSALFPEKGTKNAVRQIADMVQDQDREFNIGIRLLNSCIHQFFMGTVTNDQPRTNAVKSTVAPQIGKAKEVVQNLFKTKAKNRNH